jgi:hypothetical protein
MAKGRQEADSGTGTRDESYNLVSILYHALQGAETVGRYIDDAESAGDSELADFFRECREEDMVRAERAKLLLAQRLELEEEDIEELEDEDTGKEAPI